MNDKPPPGTEKKPRRRAAPRKRAPSKRAAKSVETRPEEASATEVVAVEAAAVSEPAAVAGRLDPAPLRETGLGSDAPSADIDLNHDAREPVTVETVARSVASPMPAAAQEPSPAVSTPSARGDVQPSREQNADAVQTPAPPAADAIPRQPSLRPGELIRVPLSVRWRDLDAFNHVNNSKYLSYLEEARLRWMLTMPGMGLEDDVAPVVAASNLNYKRPIEWPGEVVIELFVERLGNTSVTIGHRIVDAIEGGVTYCDGNVVMVWIDRTSGRAAPLPGAVRAACSRR